MTSATRPTPEGGEKLTKALDREETAVLRVHSDRWQVAPIFRSGGGQWMREARQRLKRRGLLESHPTQRRTWRITAAGRAALAKAQGEPR